MSHTTPLQPGLRRLPSGKVQARFNGRSLGVYADEDKALMARKQAEIDHREGRRPRRGRSTDPTLHAQAEGLLAAERARCEQGTIRQGTFNQKAKELRPWLLGSEWTAFDVDGFPFADLRLSQLEPARIGDWYQERRGAAPEAARKELFALKATLRDALRYGALFDHGLLALSPGKRNRRTGRALRPDVLAHLADAFPSLLNTLPLFVGTVGLRIGEALTLERDRVDLAYGTIFIPAALCKEGRDKLIPLMPNETELLRGQLLMHDHRYVWPRLRGGCWPHWDFHGKVWQPALNLARASWVAAGGMAQDFHDLRPHDLRHTAATLMRRMDFPADLVAQRLGHADSGWLMLTVYNHPDPDELQAKMIALAGNGILGGNPPLPPNVVPLATGRRGAHTQPRLPLAAGAR